MIYGRALEPGTLSDCPILSHDLWQALSHFWKKLFSEAQEMGKGRWAAYHTGNESLSSTLVTLLYLEKGTFFFKLMLSSVPPFSQDPNVEPPEMSLIILLVSLSEITPKVFVFLFSFFSYCFGYCHEFMMFLPHILAYKKSSTTQFPSRLLENSSSPFPSYGWINRLICCVWTLLIPYSFHILVKFRWL